MDITVELTENIKRISIDADYYNFHSFNKGIEDLVCRYSNFNLIPLLIEYHCTGGELYAICTNLSNQQNKNVVEVLKTNAHSTIKNFSETFFINYFKEDFSNFFKELWGNFIDPIWGFVEKQNTENIVLFFSLSGEMNNLPLHAARNNKDVELIEMYPVIHLPSPLLFCLRKNSTSRDNNKENLVLFNAKENDGILANERKIFEQSKNKSNRSPKIIWQVKDGKIELLQNNFINRLVFLTHAKYSYDNPLQSKLIYEKPITLKELILDFTINFTETELIHLPCSTGRHFKFSSLEEEWLSFAVYFITKGARNVIAPIFDVDNEVAFAFTKAFYTHLNKTLPICKIFQLAYNSTKTNSLDNCVLLNKEPFKSWVDEKKFQGQFCNYKLFGWGL